MIKPIFLKIFKELLFQNVGNQKYDFSLTGVNINISKYFIMLN